MTDDQIVGVLILLTLIGAALVKACTDAADARLQRELREGEEIWEQGLAEFYRRMRESYAPRPAPEPVDVEVVGMTNANPYQRPTLQLARPALEEGAPCPDPGCEGSLEVRLDGPCCCGAVRAPCSACENSKLVCSACEMDVR